MSEFGPAGCKRALFSQISDPSQSSRAFKIAAAPHPRKPNQATACRLLLNKSHQRSIVTMKNLKTLSLLSCMLSQGDNAFFYRVKNRSSINIVSSNMDKNEHLSTTAWRSVPKHSSIVEAIALRGGARSDSTPALFGKVASSAGVEAFLMYNILSFGVQLNTSAVSGKRYLQAALILMVVFGSSYFGQLIDNGMSAATKQVMAPNEIPGDADWYANLKKPSWNPPGWLFPIMWLIVSKPSQFVAVWKLMTSGEEKDFMLPFAMYCTHLSIGDAWNKVFFGLVSTFL